jgi:hypothetical protein
MKRQSKIFQCRGSIFSLALLAGMVAFGGEGYASEAKATADSSVKKSVDTYPFDTCPVSGAKLGSMGKPVVGHYQGREVRFCCAGCPATFEADLPGNLKKLDQALIAKLGPDYPLDTCAVSGERLGEMGTPVDYIYGNQLVRFCCAGCIGRFEKDPDKYLEKLRRAYAAEKKGKAAEGAAEEKKKTQ